MVSSQWNVNINANMRNVTNSSGQRKKRSPVVLALLSLIVIGCLLLLASSSPVLRGKNALSRGSESVTSLKDEDDPIYRRNAELARKASASKGKLSDDESKTNDIKTSHFHFPDMVAAHENEKEIFGNFADLTPDADGFVEHNVRVIGHENRYLNVNYRGRYRQDVYMHGLELHDDLLKFGCTKKGMVLEFGSQAKANQVKSDLSAVLSNSKYSKVLVGGRQILRCPKSVEPDDLLNSHLFGDDMVVEETKITQSLRRIHKVSVVKDNPTVVRLDTSYANLQDVFSDLEFSGETDMIDRNNDLYDQKFGVHGDNVDGILFEDVARERAKNYRSVPIDFEGDEETYGGLDVDDDFFKAAWNWVKKTAKKVGDWIVDNIVKPVCNFVIDGIKKVASFVKSVAGTLIKPLVKLLGKLIPVLVNEHGSTDVIPISVNYNSNTGSAAHILEFDTNGIKQGASFEVGKHVSASVMASGRVACLNCFIRFYDGVFSWKLIIGGEHVVFLELKMYTKLEAMLELDMDITISTQVTFAPQAIPIPKLSIPLGVMTLGFSVAPSITIGVVVDVQGLYYKYHLTGDQEFGVRGSMLSGVSSIRGGSLQEDTVGPIIKDGLKIKFYVLPLCGLVFSDVMAIEAGLSPTLTFSLKPRDNAGSGCTLGWSIEFDCPIVVGAWIGLKTSFGSWVLAGFSQSISVLPTIPIKSGCVTQSEIDHVTQDVSGNDFGDAVDALNQADTRGMAAVTADEAVFQTNFDELKALYTPQSAFGEDVYSWVTGSSQGCATACSDSGLHAVFSGEFQISPIYSNLYVCSVNVESEGYRPGWNKGDESATRDTCQVAGNANSAHKATGTSFKCLCVPDDMQTKVSWVQTKDYASQNCRVTCEAEGKFPISSGSYQLNNEPAGIFYPCAVNFEAGGRRTGMNIGPHHAQLWDHCRFAWEHDNVYESGNYECACMTPKEEASKPLKWIESVSDPGCQETCDRSGYFPVLSGSNGDDADFYVCGFTYSGKDLEGYSAIDTNGDYTPCYAKDGSTDRESSDMGFRCLCSKSTPQQQEYITWVDRTNTGQNCSTTCIWDHDLYPIYAHNSETEFLCRGTDSEVNAALAGMNEASSLSCNIGHSSVGGSSTTFQCGCANIDMMQSAVSVSVSLRPSTGPPMGEWVTSGTWIFKNANTNLVMEVNGNGVVVQEPKDENNANTAQHFTLELAADSPNGYFYCYVKSVSTGKVFDMKWRSTSNGGELLVWWLNEQDNQQFEVDRGIAPGKAEIWARHSSKVLETQSTSAGSQVFQWSSNGGNNQRWWLIPVY